MNDKEKQAFEELVDMFEQYKRNTEKRVDDLEEKVKKLEESVTSGT